MSVPLTPGRTTALSVMRPEQVGQAKPSTSNVRASRSAPCSRCTPCSTGGRLGDRSEPRHRRRLGFGTTWGRHSVLLLSPPCCSTAGRHRVDARRRHQRGQVLEASRGRQHDAACAIAPGPLEAQDHVSTLGPLQPLTSDRRTSEVAALHGTGVGTGVRGGVGATSGEPEEEHGDVLESAPCNQPSGRYLLAVLPVCRLDASKPTGVLFPNAKERSPGTRNPVGGSQSSGASLRDRFPRRAGAVSSCPHQCQSSTAPT